MKKPFFYKVFLGIVCLLTSCNTQTEERYTDKYGNVFIKNGAHLSIIPAKYEKTGKKYKVFIYNETESKIGIIGNMKIEPNEFIIANVVDTSVLKLNNGVEFKFGKTYGLEVEDKEQQISGLGGEYLEKYKVPDEAEWAFVIVPRGEGD